VADGQVLAAPVGGGEHTHGHAAQHVGADELADGLALVPAVVHAHVLKGALLGAQGGHLEKITKSAGVSVIEFHPLGLYTTV